MELRSGGRKRRGQVTHQDTPEATVTERHKEARPAAC